MTRGTRQRIDDILEAIDRCTPYLVALDSDDTILSRMAEDAIERNLQIIGEAASRLPAEFTDARPDIAWAEIRGFRNLLVHRYFGVDPAVVREVVEEHLPALASSLRTHVE